MVKTLESFFGAGLWAVIKAVLILLLAFIVSAIVKAIVVKLLSRTKLGSDKVNDGPAGPTNALTLIGKLVQLVVFLLFVPGIFESLGMTDVSTPILSVLNTIWGYVPNILAAAIILWLGFYIAKLVRELLIPVLNKLEVNKLQKVAGIEVSEAGKLSNTIAYLVYVIILIPVIIVALEALNIKAISEPAISMLSIIFNYLPRIIAALVIIIVGWILAKFLGNIVERLIAASGLDAKVSQLIGEKNPNVILSKIIGIAVQVIVVIFFLVESFSALHMDILTNAGTAIITYLPSVLAACITFAICYLIAGISSKVLIKNGHAPIAFIVKVLVYVIGGFMILSELGIAAKLVDAAFILLLAALAVAFAIAFGVGGRDFAKNMLAIVQKKCEETEKDDK